MPGDRERFMEAGFDAYLSKPLVLPVLAEAIKNAYIVKQEQKKSTKPYI